MTVLIRRNLICELSFTVELIIDNIVIKLTITRNSILTTLKTSEPS